MEKIDLTKIYKSYYTAKATPEMITTVAATYLAIQGKGDPSSPAFSADVEALYSTAYALKFACKQMGNDFTVAKLEGQWWFDTAKYNEIEIATAPHLVPRSEWEYRLLIRQPEFVTTQMMLNAVAATAAKKNNDHVRQVVAFEIPARTVVQALHTGPFDTEPVTLAKLKTFIDANQLTRIGLHHEIYLSDFRKTAPEKLRTILREEVLAS